MENSQDVRRSFQTTGADLLLTDLDVAMTFMDVADTSQNTETVTRNHRNARVAYDTVLDFLSRLNLLESDRQTIETKLGILKERLLAAGAILEA